MDTLMDSVLERLGNALKRDDFSSLYQPPPQRYSESVAGDVAVIAAAVYDIIRSDDKNVDSDWTDQTHYYMPMPPTADGRVIALYNNQYLYRTGGDRHLGGGNKLEAVTVVFSDKKPKSNEVALFYPYTAQDEGEKGHTVVRLNRHGDISVVLWRIGLREIPLVKAGMSTIREPWMFTGNTQLDLTAALPDIMVMRMRNTIAEDVAKLATDLTSVASVIQARSS